VGLDLDNLVKNRRLLAITFVFVVVARLAFYAAHPSSGTDFDLLYHAAQHLLRGQDPYPIVHQWSVFPLFYPLTAVFLAVPFTILPLGLARPVFDICSGWFLAYVLCRFRGPYALLGLVSGAYLLALPWSQTTPLITAASLVPLLGFLLTVKPNQGLALYAARPSWAATIGCFIFLGLTVLLLPSWPLEWWKALQQQSEHIRSLVARPFGWLLLLAGLKWRTPEGRLLLVASLVPQTSLPYELVPLMLIPRNIVEMGIFVVGSWLTLAAVGAGVDRYMLATVVEKAWPVMLTTVYLPMLYLVLKPRPDLGAGSHI
jgi:hypothetical protein